MKLSKLSLFLNLLAILTSLCSAAPPTCKPGSFLSGTKCQLCPPGTYQNKRAATTCIPCPAGFFNPLKGAPGADICQPCAAGTFSTAKGAKSRAVCKPCAAGKSSPEGADRCLSCPAGSFISKCPQAIETIVDADGVCLVCENEICEEAPAQLKCRKCDSGSFSPKKNSLQCNFCPSDTISEAGSSKCKNCPPGQGNKDFDGVCKPCDFFSFNDGNFGFCPSCPEGFRGNKKVGGTKCVACPAGTRGDFGLCKKCKPGENTLVTGATFCAPDNTPCASNFFRNSRGACERCAKSQRYNKRKNRCDDCRKNTLSKGGVDTKCSRCPRGETTQDFSITNEVDAFGGRRCVCEEGWARTATGKCKKCPAGFFRQNEILFGGDETDGDACLNCFRGTFAPRAGSSECLKCLKGTAQPLNGQTKCVKCPPGTRSTGEACVDPVTGCPKGEKRVNSGTDFFCERKEEKSRPPCSTFERFVPNKSECVPCPFGQSSKGGKSKKCQKCDGIFWAAGAGCQCVGGFGDGRELANGKCRVCRLGTFGTNGVTGCQRCPAGTFRDRSTGRGDECNYCDPGTFSTAGAAKCSRCPTGTNTFGFGFANCVKPGSL